MGEPVRRSAVAYQITADHPGGLTLSLDERIDYARCAHLLQSLQALLKARRPAALTLDLARVGFLDDAGALTLHEFKEYAEARDCPVSFSHVPAAIAPLLTDIAQRYTEFCLSPPVRPQALNVLVRLGDTLLREIFNLRYMTSFLGSVFLAFLKIVRKPRTLRFNDTIVHMKQTGVDALPIVALISFLLGLIMAFMSSLQLQQFGANIYVASLVALAMVSELGPIMTAIVVGGRSGSAYAAEIGTMRIAEEIDALYIMGFDPTAFLAIPRLLAAVIVVPLLTLFADLFAIAGGLFVGVFMLNLTPGAYISQTIETLTLFEVLWGLLKSAVFALLVAWTGCLRGFQVRGGPADVGRAATSAVVSSIFLIILFDSVFAVMRSYW